VKIRDLYQVLELLVRADARNWDKEIRVGDQVESGPYLHASVGGIFQGSQGQVIICGNDDDQWKDEAAAAGGIAAELPVLWQPADLIPVER
jgi:hypothetical protein